MPARKRQHITQPGLFGPFDGLSGVPQAPGANAVGPAPARPVDVALAAALPPGVYLGTSSWTFPGWGQGQGEAGGAGLGLVYNRRATPAQLATPAGLNAYASHPLMRTVGLDRAFYSLLGEADYRGLAGSVPVGFRFVVKANQLLTRPFADERGQTFGPTASHGHENPVFLDPAFANDRVIGPAVAGLGDRCGPILFQFPPMRLEVSGFLRKLEGFLVGLPRGPAIAVEVRSRAVIDGANAGRYAGILAAHGVSHGYCHHPSMPGLGEQHARVGGVLDRGPVVVRWLLRHGLGYEQAKGLYEPFDRLCEPDGAALAGVVELVAEAVRQGREAYVIVNNKAEGSAPLSVGRVAAGVARALG